MQANTESGSGSNAPWFQSSSSPKTGCKLAGFANVKVKPLPVSILIQPEDRMQVGRDLPTSRSSHCQFQSSSSPKTGCKSGGDVPPWFPNLFQSSSSPKTGCKSRASTSPPPSSSFNPHPARRPDASRAATSRLGFPTCFNPHPARRPDARAGHRLRRHPVLVSILIQPEDRMQVVFAVVPTMIIIGFNPHPARRPDASRLRRGPDHDHHRFQSSSSPKTGCEAWCATCGKTFDNWFQSSSSPKTGCKSPVHRSLCLHPVSILIQPEDRMQVACSPVALPTSCFNPHPARRPDASRLFTGRSAYILFQSSSSPKTGCK